MNYCSICGSSKACAHREIGLLQPGKDRQGIMYSIAAESTGFRRRNSLRTDEDRAKSKARRLVGTAIKSGLIKKAAFCAKCGGERNIQAHHIDYAKPLLVVWLCKPCHYIADALRITVAAGIVEIAENWLPRPKPVKSAPAIDKRISGFPRKCAKTKGSPLFNRADECG